MESSDQAAEECIELDETVDLKKDFSLLSPEPDADITSSTQERAGASGLLGFATGILARAKSRVGQGSAGKAECKTEQSDRTEGKSPDLWEDCPGNSTVAEEKDKATQEEEEEELEEEEEASTKSDTPTHMPAEKESKRSPSPKPPSLPEKKYPHVPEVDNFRILTENPRQNRQLTVDNISFETFSKHPEMLDIVRSALSFHLDFCKDVQATTGLVGTLYMVFLSEAECLDAMTKLLELEVEDGLNVTQGGLSARRLPEGDGMKDIHKALSATERLTAINRISKSTAVQFSESLTVVVRGIPEECTEQDLLKLYPEASDAVIGLDQDQKPNGLGYVQFLRQADAAKAYKAAAYKPFDFMDTQVRLSYMPSLELKELRGSSFAKRPLSHAYGEKSPLLPKVPKLPDRPPPRPDRRKLPERDMHAEERRRYDESPREDRQSRDYDSYRTRERYHWEQFKTLPCSREQPRSRSPIGYLSRSQGGYREEWRSHEASRGLDGRGSYISEPRKGSALLGQTPSARDMPWDSPRRYGTEPQHRSSGLLPQERPYNGIGYRREEQSVFGSTGGVGLSNFSGGLLQKERDPLEILREAERNRLFMGLLGDISQAIDQAGR